MSTADRIAKDRARFDQWARNARETGEVPAIPAATVVLLRDGDAGVETIMLRKNSKIAFGGMWVFPGGRIDEADRAGLAPDDDVAAACTAAVREAEEETNLVIDPGDLVLFSYWNPPPIAPKRFATWFFAAPAGAEDVRIDDGEIVEGQWMAPSDALDRHHEGEIELVPPTWVTLHTLSEFPDVATALRLLGDTPVRQFATRIGRDPGGPVAMWEGDAGYDTSDAATPGARHRLEMFESGYRYIHTGATSVGRGN